MTLTARLSIAVLSVCLVILSVPVSRADSPSPAGGELVAVSVKPQAWQARRAEFARILNAIDSKDAASVEAFRSVLTEFEGQPFSRTPMENMEILGVYYLPKEGIEAVLTYIAANAALGWYDALRHGSESGRSEILHNEGFFKLPLMLAGDEFVHQAVKFFEEQPAKTDQLVQRGIAIADMLKDDPRYDHLWPSAYGLERMMCAMGAECGPPGALPKAQWADAWEETKARVARYYRINPPQASPPASAAKKAPSTKSKKR